MLRFLCASFLAGWFSLGLSSSVLASPSIVEEHPADEFLATNWTIYNNVTVYFHYLHGGKGGEYFGKGTRVSMPTGSRLSFSVDTVISYDGINLYLIPANEVLYLPHELLEVEHVPDEHRARYTDFYEVVYDPHGETQGWVYESDPEDYSSGSVYVYTEASAQGNAFASAKAFVDGQSAYAVARSYVNGSGNAKAIAVIRVRD